MPVIYSINMASQDLQASNLARIKITPNLTREREYKLEVPSNRDTSPDKVNFALSKIRMNCHILDYFAPNYGMVQPPSPELSFPRRSSIITRHRSYRLILIYISGEAASKAGVTRVRGDLELFQALPPEVRTRILKLTLPHSRVVEFI